ncbi:MAG: TIM barrel protein [Gemmataceae bacterium]|nr:TIM barrel protein [Gemmataceae bacterium]MCI0739911.1 TIM barrel protein [Gemmataceae bacterium]
MADRKKIDNYRFTFGPWNISTGADPFGPPVRKEVVFASKIKEYKKLGFDGVQFHDDDVVEADLAPAVSERGVAKVRKMLQGEGLFCEFIAPRLWEHPKTIDGAFTSNDPGERKYAIERSKRAVDIANAMGTRNIVLWLAREGTYIREAKDPVTAVSRIVDAINALLEYDPNIRILGEMKPNEPMDQAYLPTPGHFMGLTYRTADPSRVGVLIESAHSILAGLDPSDDMAYALWHGKLWSVHLNDQNALKYDQDKTFGAVDMRRAFNQVWVLERGGYDGCIGLDVKAMRTTKQADQTKHLANSRAVFLRLVELAREVNEEKVEGFRARRDYESLEMYVLDLLTGK